MKALALGLCGMAGSAALLGVACPASAQQEGEATVLRPAAGVEIQASADADETDVLKILARGLWHFEGRDEYQGLAIERARFSFRNADTHNDTRVYLDLADDLDGDWLWRGRIGTDGDTVLGSATLRTADWRQTYFIEREIIETPRGVDEGIYYTFLGAAYDLPVDDRNVFTVMAGLQEFTGENERLHARANFIHVVKPEWGLSGQLRGRYYHSTAPGEFDYYSPENYLQLLPTLQLQRFDDAGWMYRVRGGYGAQYATAGSWTAARLAEMRIESPASSNGLHAFVDLHYSNSSVLEGPDYDYVAGRIGVTLRP